MVYDMCFETELSDKLNNELESAGISVSEALIAKTLAAVQAARSTAENETPDAEWTEASEENINKLIELAKARKGRWKRIAPLVFKTATVMAACLVLVVGAFALRFSTMRMGKDNAETAQAPMMTAENSSVPRDMKADADANGAADNYMYYSETSESLVMESAVAADGITDAVEFAVEADDVADAMESPVTAGGIADAVVEPIVPTTEDDADAVVEEAEESVVSEVQDVAKELTIQLERAESVALEYTAQGTAVYRFVVREANASAVCYLVHENGRVECAELTSDGETGAVMLYDSVDSKAFQRTVLVWMKQNGYSF